MTTNRTPRPSVRSARGARLLRLFRPSAPLDGDRDAQRLQSDLRAARSRQLPDA